MRFRTYGEGEGRRCERSRTADKPRNTSTPSRRLPVSGPALGRPFPLKRWVTWPAERARRRPTNWYSWKWICFDSGAHTSDWTTTVGPGFAEKWRCPGHIFTNVPRPKAKSIDVRISNCVRIALPQARQCDSALSVYALGIRTSRSRKGRKITSSNIAVGSLPNWTTLTDQFGLSLHKITGRTSLPRLRPQAAMFKV